MSGCCSPENPWTEHRIIQRWLDVDPPQQLEVNHVCNTTGNGTCCILDECDGGFRRWLQYQDCHIYYNGSTVWEWHPKTRQCVKLLEGAGLPLNKWPITSKTGHIYVGN